MYNHNTYTWKPATFIHVVPAPMSFQLSTNDVGAYRRDRCNIRATPSTTLNRVTPPHSPIVLYPI